MKFQRLTAIGVPAAICLAAAAIAGLPGASAKPTPVQPAAAHLAAFDTGKPLVKCLKFDFDDQLVCGIMRRGPQGARGPKGLTGKTGPIGLTGATGPQGPQGPQGPVGAVGPVGPQGVQGIQGIQGTPGHSVVVAGTPITETGAQAAAAPNAGPGGVGAEIPASIAQCPTGSGSKEPEAYGGGVQIQKSGSEIGGDVVTIDQQYLGTYDSANQVVDPLSGGSPGLPSAVAATAYQGNAVVTNLAVGDTVTVQAYVVCGP